MNLQSKFIHSLIALAAAVPVSTTVAMATTEAAAASTIVSPGKIDFSSNLAAKLNNVAPADPVIFGQVWVRTDFVEIQSGIQAGAQSAGVSAVEAFDLVNRA
jgi:hypothetical protein